MKKFISIIYMKSPIGTVLFVQADCGTRLNQAEGELHLTLVTLRENTFAKYYTPITMQSSQNSLMSFHC